MVCLYLVDAHCRPSLSIRDKFSNWVFSETRCHMNKFIAHFRLIFSYRTTLCWVVLPVTWHPIICKNIVYKIFNRILVIIFSRWNESPFRLDFFNCAQKNTNVYKLFDSSRKDAFAVDRVNESHKFSLRLDHQCYELVDPLLRSG